MTMSIRSCLCLIALILLPACGGSSRPPAHREPPEKAASTATAEGPTAQNAPVASPAPSSPSTNPPLSASGAPLPALVPVPSPSPVIILVPKKQEELKILFVSAGKEDAVPQEGQEGERESLLRFNGGSKVVKAGQPVLKYDDALVLPRQGQKPVFVVFGNEALGKEIAEAYFTHRTRSKEGTLQERQKEALAQFQPAKERARWFIDLSKLFPKRSEVDSSFTQILHLRLVFKDWSHFEADIEFRAWGGPPDVSWSAAFGPGRDGRVPNDFVRDVLNNGWPILFDDIVNSTPRTARIWFRIMTQNPFLHSAYVKTPVYRDFPFGDVPRSSKPSELLEPLMQSSEARFFVDKVRVGESQKEASAGQWQFIDLAPGQQTRISWIASRDFQFPVISLKQHLREISWRRPEQERGQFCVTYRGHSSCEIYKQALNETPEIMGSVLDGVLGHEIRATDPSLSTEAATQETLDQLTEDSVKVLVRDQGRVRLEHGTLFEGHAERVWQGVPVFSL